MEKGSSLYILSGLWSVHGRNVAYGHVLVRILALQFSVRNQNSSHRHGWSETVLWLPKNSLKRLDFGFEEVTMLTLIRA